MVWFVCCLIVCLVCFSLFGLILLFGWLVGLFCFVWLFVGWFVCLFALSLLLDKSSIAHSCAVSFFFFFLFWFVLSASNFWNLEMHGTTDVLPAGTHSLNVRYYTSWETVFFDSSYGVHQRRLVSIVLDNQSSDKCAQDPCLNGGVCSLASASSPPGYTCSCPAGFSGEFCETSTCDIFSCPRRCEFAVCWLLLTRARVCVCVCVLQTFCIVHRPMRFIVPFSVLSFIFLFSRQTLTTALLPRALWAACAWTAWIRPLAFAPLVFLAPTVPRVCRLGLRAYLSVAHVVRCVRSFSASPFHSRHECMQQPALLEWRNVLGRYCLVVLYLPCWLRVSRLLYRYCVTWSFLCALAVDVLFVSLCLLPLPDIYPFLWRSFRSLCPFPCVLLLLSLMLLLLLLLLLLLQFTAITRTSLLARACLRSLSLRTACQ